MTIKDVVKKMDVKGFLKQKEWLAKQESNDTCAAGMLHFLDEIQDAAERELDMSFGVSPETDEVTEWCSNCEREITLQWNIEEDGLKAFCPHCGERLMLCAYCPATYGEENCDFDGNTDTCRYNQKQKCKQEKSSEDKESTGSGRVNTLIQYLYRDASNYKVYNQAIIPGVLSDEQKQLIWTSLQEGEYFIAELVGLPGERFYGTEDDHPYFELQSIEATKKQPTVNVSGDELVMRFQNHKNLWETFAVMM